MAMVPHTACYTHFSDTHARSSLDIHVGDHDGMLAWVLAAVSILQISIFLHDISRMSARGVVAEVTIGGGMNVC